MNFESFIKKGIVKVQSPDKSRAEFLIKESNNSYSLLLRKIEKLGIDDESANDYVKSCYDILMELIRANMLLKGYNATGFGAHEAEVSYTRILNFKENDIQILDHLRYIRNGMLYYGSITDKEYSKKIIEFTKRVYLRLKKITVNI